MATTTEEIGRTGSDKKLERQVSLDLEDVAAVAPLRNRMLRRSSWTSLGESLGNLWGSKRNVVKAEEPKKAEIQRRKTVSFAMDESRVSESSYTFTRKEKQRMWYSEDELVELQDEVMRVVDGEKSIQEGQDSMRGLEMYLDEDRGVLSEECNIIMLENYLSVKKAGMEDSFDFESLGSSLSEDAIRWGDMQAAQDSAEAYMIYLETMEPEMVNPCFRSQ